MNWYTHTMALKKIFLGTTNKGKTERFKKLLASTGLEIEVHVPSEFGLQDIEVEEKGATLAENAVLKARAYFGKVPLPILTNDTGFWVEGEGLVEAPKRVALGNGDEKKMSEAEIATMLIEFWKNVARKHGGKVDAAWVEEFVLLDPDGRMHTSQSRREVILTDQEFGAVHPQMPVRALYISKDTDKPAALHTAEEEIRELKPITDALLEVLTD